MALPASLALVPVLFVGVARRDRAFAAVAVIESAAWIIGALLGGILTATMLGWRFVFLATVPVIVATYALAARVLPESQDARAPAHLDLWGAVIVTACLAQGVYAISQFDSTDPLAVPFVAAAAVCAGCGCAFWVIERLAARSHSSTRPCFGCADCGEPASGSRQHAYGAMVFVGTLYLQGIAYGAAGAGKFFLAAAVGAFASPLFGRLLSRYDARPVAFAGLGTVAAALVTFAVLAQLGMAKPYAVVLTLLVFGVGQYAAWVAWSGSPPTTWKRRSTGWRRADPICVRV